MTGIARRLSALDEYLFTSSARLGEVYLLVRFLDFRNDGLIIVLYWSVIRQGAYEGDREGSVKPTVVAVAAFVLLALTGLQVSLCIGKHCASARRQLQ